MAKKYISHGKLSIAAKLLDFVNNELLPGTGVTKKRFWDGKIPPKGGIFKFSLSHERHIPIPVQVTISPHEWLSRRGEKKILHKR